MFLVTDSNGKANLCDGGRQLVKAMGCNFPENNLVMTDERGQIIGLDSDANTLMKSADTISALKSGELIMKSATAAMDRLAREMDRSVERLEAAFDEFFKSRQAHA